MIALIVVVLVLMGCAAGVMMHQNGTLVRAWAWCVNLCADGAGYPESRRFNSSSTSTYNSCDGPITVMSTSSSMALPEHGIANAGNSCYFGSAVQLLTRVYGDDLVALGDSKQDALVHLANLVQHVRGSRRLKSNGYDEVGRVIGAVCGLNDEALKKFGFCRQADSSSAASYLMYLIDNLQRQTPSPKYYFQSVQQESSASEQWDAFCTEHPAPFTQKQCGQYVTESRCLKCNATVGEPPLYTGFAMITVDASAVELRHVQDAVDRWSNCVTTSSHCSEEPCRSCGTVESKRCRRITRFPATGALLVTINREYHDHQGVARKHHGGLDVPDTVTFTGTNEEPIPVQLVAACLHQGGSVSAGHYICAVAGAGGIGCAIADDSKISVRASGRITTESTFGSLFAFAKVPLPQQQSYY